MRRGLSVIPALMWQYLVTPHPAGKIDTWFEVEGVTTIDTATAKSLYDRGVVFIYTSLVGYWKEGHIPNAVSLRRVSTFKRLKETTLLEVANKTDEVVFYGGTIDAISASAAFSCAKAVTWGFTRVYYFADGVSGWHKAGYPLEKGQ